MNKSCTSTWWSLKRECFGIFQLLSMLWSSLSIRAYHLDCPKKTKTLTSAAMKQMISQASFGLLWGPLFKISRPNNTVNPVAQWHLIHAMYKRIWAKLSSFFKEGAGHLLKKQQCQLSPCRYSLHHLSPFHSCMRILQTNDQPLSAWAIPASSWL